MSRKLPFICFENFYEYYEKIFCNIPVVNVISALLSNNLMEPIIKLIDYRFILSFELNKICQ